MSIPGKQAVGFTMPGGYLLPQEEMLEIGKKQSKLSIGIPKEDQKYESRVPLTPEAVEILTGNGHEVYLQKEQEMQQTILIMITVKWVA